MNDMTKGSIVRIIITFTIPMILGNIFQQLYNIVDSKIVSMYVGTEAFAAVGMTAVVSNTLIGFINGFTQGFSILVANSFGAKDFKRLRKNIAGSVKLVVVLIVVLMCLGFAFIRPILGLLNTPDDIMETALLYVRIIMAGIPFTALYNLSANTLRAVGDSKTPLYCLILAVVLNTLLDLLMVAILGMGIVGAALATIISQCICAFVCLCYIIIKFKQLIPHGDEWNTPKEMTSALFSTGLSMGLMGCIVNIGTIILQSGINGLGTEIIAAHTAGRRLLDMLMILIFTYGFTMTTFVSQNLGAGEVERIKSGIRTAIAIVSIITTVLIVICFLVSKPIITWIASTDNPAIIEPAVNNCRFGVCFFYALGPLFILRCSLQGLGRKTIPLLTSGLELSIKVTSILIFVPLWSYWGVIITEPVSWCVMTLVLAIGYIRIAPKVYETVKETMI